MKYTQISKDIIEERELVCQPTDNISLRKAHTDITYFSYYLLGIKPYSYQYMIFKTFQKGCKRISVCSSRQIGKSIAIAVIALWAAVYNTQPSGIHKNTQICVISKSDDQSKKLMNEIKKLIYLGDLTMKERTKHLLGHPDPRFRNMYQSAYFSDKVDTKATNNMNQMTFRNGCTIKCFAPTDACRGESASILLVDEAAFVDENMFKDAMYPTVTATRGSIILSSTPKGQKGFFFKLFDPFDIYDNHEYTRFWFNWRMCENDDMREDIKRKKKQAEIDGDTKHFEQEYEANFTIDCESFYVSDFVNDGIDKNLEQVHESVLPVCVGVDYGMTNCHTVISIVGMKDKKLFLLKQVKYPLGTPDTLVYEDLKEIYRKFPNLKKFVIDDGPQSFRTITDLKREGLPILSFSFKKDKIRGYYLHRSALNKGLLHYPLINELLVEMKALISESGFLSEKICKPRGGFDDRIDSFMIACFPFLAEEENNTQSFVVGANSIRTDLTDWNTGKDLTWEILNKDWERREMESKLKNLNNPLFKKGYMDKK